MGSFNPLASILKDNKLTGPNFITWKRNLDIVLTSDDYKFVLTEPCPPIPSKDDSEMDHSYYELWKKADRMATCYMLASMSDVLQSQHQSMGSAADIMLNLTEMFGGQSRAARQVAMKALMNTNMAEGTPVRDHVLKMIGHLNELEILGAEIDGETQIDILLQSLPNSFNQFRLNYTMNKLNYTLAELLKELQAAEGVIKKSTHAFVAEKASSSRPFNGKKKKKGQQKNARRADQMKPSLTKAKVPKGKCYICQKSGHWKRDCPERKNKESSGMSVSFVVESCLVDVSTGTWCVDTGATNHVCKSLQGFQVTRQLRDGEIHLQMGNNSQASALAVGELVLYFSRNKHLKLKNVLYVPEIRRNLVSVSCLGLDGYEFLLLSIFVIFCLRNKLSVVVHWKILFIF